MFSLPHAASAFAALLGIAAGGCVDFINQSGSPQPEPVMSGMPPVLAEAITATSDGQTIELRGAADAAFESWYVSAINLSAPGALVAVTPASNGAFELSLAGQFGDRLRIHGWHPIVDWLGGDFIVNDDGTVTDLNDDEDPHACYLGIGPRALGAPATELHQTLSIEILNGCSDSLSVGSGGALRRSGAATIDFEPVDLDPNDRVELTIEVPPVVGESADEYFLFDLGPDRLPYALSILATAPPGPAP